MRLRASVVSCLALALCAACGDREEPKPPAPPTTALAPDDAARMVALENRGIALLERYDYNEAVAPLRQASELAPDWLAGRFNLALALIHASKDDPKEARAILDRLVREHPDHPHVVFVSGWLAERGGQAERALELYRKAYELTGRDAIVAAKLGTLLANLDGHEQEALAILEESHARNPALISPVNQLQLLHRRIGTAEGDAKAEQYLALLVALKGKANPQIDRSAIGQELQDAYGNMGPYSMAIRDFGDPGTAVARGGGKVTATIAVLTRWKAGALPAGAPYLGAAVLDYDGDGDLDLFVCGGEGPSALLRNDGALKFTDVAEAAGVALRGAYLVAAGEMDVAPTAAPSAQPGRRARVDLVVVHAGAQGGGIALLRNRGDGTFEDATERSGLGADPGGARALLLVDADQEGDLDLFVSGADGARNRLWANRGDGRFDEVAAAGGAQGDGGAYGPAVVVDVDEDYDLDLVVTRPSADTVVFVNERMLRFRETSAGAPGVRAVHGAVAGDFDRDGREDVLLCAEAGATLLRGGGASSAARAVALAGAPGGPAVDVDVRLVGLRDLVFAEGTRLPAAEQGEPFAAAHRLFAAAGTANVLAADLDGEGGEEIVLVRPGVSPQVATLSAEDRGNALVLDFEGVIRNDVQAGWSNLEGRGALVEVKAGTLWQQIRVGNPVGFDAGSPTRVVVGVGRAKQADFVRILWPDGVQHAVLDVPVGAPYLVVEEQRRPDSCPLLFSWDGRRFAFVTDFLGVGGIGFLVAPGVYGAPDPTESVKVDASLVRQDASGNLVFKLVEAMEEVCYFDRVQLEVLDHPAGVTVFPDERFAGEPPFPDGQTLAYREEILPVAARDGAGTDVLDLVATVDRRYPESFALHPRLLGATEEQVLELDFGDRLAGVAPGDGIVLYAHGWIEYGYTRTSVAAAGEGFAYQVPTLEAFDAATGTWRTLVANLGYPAGFPRVMTYDVTGVVSRETPRLRIRTNFEVYWDRVWLALEVDAEHDVRRTLLDPTTAELRRCGYPREYSPDGGVPRIYDYHTTDPSMPWKTVEGEFTRFGDVRPLVLASDDMYVICGKGEEVDVRFAIASLPPLPDGWTRSYVLRFDGWCKGQELYTAHGMTVEPLPFHGMSNYPYRDDERYPDDAAHRRYRAEWNTRRVRGVTR